MELQDITDPWEGDQEEELEWDGGGLLDVPNLNEYNQRLFRDNPLGDEPTVRQKIEQESRDKLVALSVIFDDSFDPTSESAKYLLDNIAVEKGPENEQFKRVLFIGQEVVFRDVKPYFSQLSRKLQLFKSKANDAMQEFDQSESGQFNQLVEIEESLLPRVEGETKRQHAKRVLRNLLKRPKLDENEMLRLQSFKEWAKRNLFVLSGVAIAIASAITAVILVMKRALRSSSKVFKKQTKLDPKTSPIAPFYNWILDGGSKALEFASKNLFVSVFVVLLLFYFWKTK